MHFALPPRKTSQPPPYARAAVRPHSTARQRQLQLLGYAVLGILTLYLFYSYIASSTSAVARDGEIEPNPDVVIVTVLDDKTMSKEYIRMIKANREDYAKRHGYTNFYTNTSSYLHMIDNIYNPPPSSWCMIPAMRHALKVYPKTDFLWHLSALALITEPELSLSTHIFSNLSSLMQKDVPVVPPDSVIHTFSHLKPSHAHLILTQDRDNIAHTNLILRNTPLTPKTTDNWAHYFLDAWFDPLYRFYAFQKAENHALEHIVQWHPTILAKVVLIPQRRLNSYNFATKRVVDNGVERTHDSMWQEGDFVVNLKGCDDDQTNAEIEAKKGKEIEKNGRNCEQEMSHYFTEWQKKIREIDGGKS